MLYFLMEMSYLDKEEENLVFSIGLQILCDIHLSKEKIIDFAYLLDI